VETMRHQHTPDPEVLGSRGIQKRRSFRAPKEGRFKKPLAHQQDAHPALRDHLTEFRGPSVALKSSFVPDHDMRGTRQRMHRALHPVEPALFRKNNTL